MYILGVSAFYHDSAAALIKDGEIVAAAQEERFSRKKHDERYPRNAVAYCLKEAGITIDDIDYVAFYEKPFLKLERLLDSYFAFAPQGLLSFLKAMPIWLKQKLWVKEMLRKDLGYQGTILFPTHHESHAASAFYPSPFEDAVTVTLDGVGEWATTSISDGHNNVMTPLQELHFPHSLGLLYSAFTYYLGFKVNSGEYKVMGLAPYGVPRYVDTIYEHLIDLKEDGSFRINMSYFNYGVGLTMTNNAFHKLFGAPPRTPESALTTRDMDIAASLQIVTEEIIMRIARHAQELTGQNNLCLAGGVALNCVANGKLLESNIFDRIWIQPAAGDAGGALGAALYVWYQHLGNERVVQKEDSMKGAFLGPSWTTEEVATYLTSEQIPFTTLSREEIPHVAADLINEQNVVGWFQGRMEFGPRALGARSIIGDARSGDMQKTMNLKIKFRESFRPFAPSILLEEAPNYFELTKESPYMLLVAQVASDKVRNIEKNAAAEGFNKLPIERSVIPAVTHVDYSARVQTVDGTGNPLYYALLQSLNERYGSPVLINTSFNVRGEPIVCTPEDALRCFMRTEMDYLLIEGCLVSKTDVPARDNDDSWKQEYELD